MEIPESIKTSSLYVALQQNDPTNISFPPEYSNFELLTPPPIEHDLIETIKIYDYWGVTEIDRAFYERYTHQPIIFSKAKPIVGHLPLFRTIEILCNFNDVCGKFVRSGDLTGLKIAHKLGLPFGRITVYLYMEQYPECHEYVRKHGGSIQACLM